MNFIHFLVKSKAIYSIYKLQPKDRLIYSSQSHKYHSYIIISGYVLLKNIINNQKSITLAIMNHNQIINAKSTNNISNNIFEIEALTTTYILTFINQKIINNRNIKNKFINNTFSNYPNQLKFYQKMTYIVSHKFTKYKFLQLIFYLSLEFGIITNNTITIPIYINTQQIVKILGSNISNINYTIQYYKPCITIGIKNKKIISINNIKHLVDFYCY